MAERSQALPAAAAAWREIHGGSGKPGTAHLPLQRPTGAVIRRRKPGEVLWAVYRQNLDGSEPRYYLSNAPEDIPLDTLAYVGGSRWRIETEFETEKSDVGLGRIRDPQLGRVGITTSTMCLLAGAFLLTLHRIGGKMPLITRAPSVPSGA